MKFAAAALILALATSGAFADHKKGHKKSKTTTSTTEVHDKDHAHVSPGKKHHDHDEAHHKVPAADAEAAAPVKK